MHFSFRKVPNFLFVFLVRSTALYLQRESYTNVSTLKLLLAVINMLLCSSERYYVCLSFFKIVTPRRWELRALCSCGFKEWRVSVSLLHAPGRMICFLRFFSKSVWIIYAHSVLYQLTRQHFILQTEYQILNSTVWVFSFPLQKISLHQVCYLAAPWGHCIEFNQCLDLFFFNCTAKFNT